MSFARKVRRRREQLASKLFNKRMNELRRKRAEREAARKFIQGTDPMDPVLANALTARGL